MKKITAIPLTKQDVHNLRIHIYGTYITLRLGMGALAAVFPLTLYIAGKLHGIDLQGSMSAYYWVGADGTVAPRTVFVGGLLAIAAFLYLYKGFTGKENLALNLAAIFAAGVAFFPMSWNCTATITQGSLSHCPAGWNPHGASAIALFVCLAYVSIFRAKDTLPALENPKLEFRFKSVYKITGVLMLISPLIAAILRVFFNKMDAYTYFLELAGILAFASYWIIKSYEMYRTKLVESVLEGRLITPPPPPPPSASSASSPPPAQVGSKDEALVD